MADLITLFLCGDVMTGRGIDQALPHPGNPQLHERYVKDARRYVELAERANGPIRQPVDFAYIWGDALDELERVAPDVRLINLETSITQSGACWPGKAVHYRMNPQNISCLTAVGIDSCALANNHVLDWGHLGLAETLITLRQAGLKAAGAGADLSEAHAPAIMELEGKGRVLLFSFGSSSSGIPSSWAARPEAPGINLLSDLSDQSVRQIADDVAAFKQAGDVVVASMHWGGNWGYAIPRAYREFAHKLVDRAHIDVIHGHSSHHVKGIEVYKDRPIIYGCGDFLTDYEGIRGYEQYRDDLGLMYFAGINPLSGKLARLQLTPTRMKRFKLNRATQTEAMWIRDVLNREGRKLGTAVEMGDDNTLTLRWN